jgi:hypothetical protein
MSLVRASRFYFGLFFVDYLPELAAIFFTMARTSLRSLSFRLEE